MLHAELHGKVGLGADDAERSEDVLTSTVFGVLICAEAWPVLRAWFERARPVGAPSGLPPARGSGGPYWFWPRLDDAEPDVVLRLGDILYVVEAKYLSGKSGGSSSADDAVVSTDQLVREWRACSPRADMRAYPGALRDAIERCARVLVYLVKRSRWGREQRAIAESAAQVPSGCMCLLTWEDLDEVLSSETAPWARELAAYLHRRGLSAFRGFGRALAPGDAPTWLAGWRRDGRSVATSLRTFLPASSLPRLAALGALTSFGGQAARPTWARTFTPDRLPHLAALARRRPRFDALEDPA